MSDILISTVTEDSRYPRTVGIYKNQDTNEWVCICYLPEDSLNPSYSSNPTWDEQAAMDFAEDWIHYGIK